METPNPNPMPNPPACADTCGTLPECAPLAVPYVPFQQTGSRRYSQQDALNNGTLFPGLNLPFHLKVDARNVVNGPLAELQALEFVVSQTTRNLGIPLKDLRLKRGILLAVLVHQNRIIIPEGSSVISPGDTVIIVCRDHAILDLNDIYEDSLLDKGGRQ